jgi:hypothetical protein
LLSDKLHRKEMRTLARRAESHLGEGIAVTSDQTALGLTSRRLGRTALHLPVIGFGSAHLGELYRKVSEEESRATLAAAWDRGIRYYDTAPWYGRGLSEHRLGGFLRTLPRDQFQVTTKVGRTLHRPADPATFDRGPWTGGLNFDVHFDYSYDGVMRSYEQALQRLALDTVDALVIHDLEAMFHGDRTTDYRRQLTDGGGIRALQELKAAGQIKAFGMGVNTDDALDNVAAGARSGFPPRGHALHASRPAGAAPRDGALRREGDGRHHRRALRLGHPRDGIGRGRDLCLWQGVARGAGQGARHRADGGGSRRDARLRGAPVRARASRRGLGHPRGGAAAEVAGNVAALRAKIPAASGPT